LSAFRVRSRLSFWLMSALNRYWGPNENFVHIVRALLGGFQPHGVDEIIEGLKDGGVSAVEGGDFCRGNTLVSSKGLQDAGSERSIKFVVELQEHQADLIAVWEQPVAAGMGVNRVFWQAARGFGRNRDVLSGE